ncbi:hypothetical protein PCANC_04151 [Puccinia coronata f. sp. avenae]|uniref:Uncharacterized protein n=1 Tax=Puccinia coronata f. sp. avenae TaxID=200324 RepID=A0A2N5W7F6_9BASI|nr:hypothetical protein PCANC_04151 [Puccinia coronata f. sp. avenae]
MVLKRLNDALVQIQSRSGLADALKSVSWTAASVRLTHRPNCINWTLTQSVRLMQFGLYLSSCVLLTPLVLEPNASKGHLDLGGTSYQPNVEATTSTNTVNMENKQSAAETEQSLIQLVLLLPPPLISLLVVCSRPIHITAQLSLALNWVHPLGPWPSWILLLIMWYLVCLLAPLLLSNGLPNLIFLAAFLAASYHQKLNSSSSSSSPTTPSSETTQVTLWGKALMDKDGELFGHQKMFGNIDKHTICMPTPEVVHKRLDEIL